MTALCGGGASGPKSGVTGILSFTAGAIEVFISSVLGLSELAPVLAPIVASTIDIDLAGYCSTDPPADPGLTALDVATAVLVPPDDSTFAAQTKILNWFKNRYWWQICQCTSTTTPAPPTPSNPGPVSSDPGLPVQSTPCWSVSTTWAVPGNSGGIQNRADYTSVALPAGVVYPITIQTSPTVISPTVVMPPGITNLRLDATLDNPIVGTAGQHIFVNWNGYNNTGGNTTENTPGILYLHGGIDVGGSTFTMPNVPSDIRSMAIWVENTDTADHSGTLRASFFCPPGVSVGQSCCPPDPLLEGELQTILQYVQAIYAGLPIPPNSFAEGTVHSGLTGNGSITFSGLPIALKVTLTTIPPALGFEVGSPNFYFDVGYLSFSTSEGNYAQERLSLVDQVVQVPLLAGSVGYTLLNGVIATITELLPGP